MDDKTRKLILIIAVIAIGVGILAGVTKLGQKTVLTDEELLAQPLGVAITDNVARINHNGVILTFPAPDQYCFLDQSIAADNAAHAAMTNIQRAYSNHLWLVFANCEELKVIREKNDLSTYIDTGMIVTPLAGMNIEMPAETIVEAATENLKKLNPLTLEDMMNKNIKQNIPEMGAAKTGQPIVYGSDKKALFFSITHDMSGSAEAPAFKMTEFDVITTVKERPVMMIFTYKDLDDLTSRQAFTQSYVDQVRQAN